MAKMEWEMFKRELHVLAKLTRHTKADGTTRLTPDDASLYYEKLKNMDGDHLMWTLTEAGKRCTKGFPRYAELYFISRDYKGPLGPRKEHKQKKGGCSLEQALTDPDIKRNWDTLLPEIRENFERKKR